MIGKVLKRQTTIIAVTVIALCIGLLGISYAAFFRIDNSEEQIVKSGELAIQFETPKNSITTANVPQSDIDGEKNAYIFSVTNEGSLAMAYDIYVYDDPDATGEGTPIPHDYIKVKLDEQEVKFLNTYEIVTLEDDPTPKSKINLTSLKVEPKDEEGYYQNHTIKIWIDEDAPESIIGNIVALKVEVFGSAE